MTISGVLFSYNSVIAGFVHYLTKDISRYLEKTILHLGLLR